ncbi:CaiB/BaiF CoA-transferase family protein [Algiphilus sp. W345]|uniref:CaiB/BaiF CoA-transferase family protein n=1 Tax=Banduia mediterranea TaxID=3075609 RepID=A0ABU2WE39_9GAMM|nr:CaiB/BaiF CoA-transferase family protein [Algiphilus sp. W345]MDT0496147.1 CaiB/BaiF CoA-transferase family protein [Algiphilus sp. W345]
MTGGRNAWLPLSGLRVLDFSLLLPGPFATVTLADLGAEVIKIEPPAGDFARRMAGPMHAMANRNKRTLALDLKNPAVRPLIERLARWADVAVEGFRPGVAQRLGVDHATLSALNPRLVYCSISGYGQHGPARDTPGHDLNYLAASGALMFPGHWHGAPQRSGIPVADLAGASFAIIAILAALHERQCSGRGAHLDLALADAALAFATARHGLDAEGPSRAHLYPTNDIFETADGRSLALGLIEPHFWAGFVAASADLAPDFARPAWADEAGRLADGDALHRRLTEVLRLLSSAQWLARFARHDVPAQTVLSPAEAGRSPQAQARALVMERDGERHLPFPVWANGRRGGHLECTAAAVGAHGPEILTALGLSAAQIAALHAAGAVTLPPTNPHNRTEKTPE